MKAAPPHPHPTPPLAAAMDGACWLVSPGYYTIIACMLCSDNLLTTLWQVCCLNLQAEVDSSSKDLQKLERTLQVQQSDLKALQHHLDEKDSMVGSNTN